MNTPYYTISFNFHSTYAIILKIIYRLEDYDLSDYNRPNNNRKDDIDDFFSQFEKSAPNQDQKYNRRNATIHGRNTTTQRGTQVNNDRTSRSASNPSQQRPNRSTEYRTQADRDAAKAHRKAIMQNQPGAKRYSERHAAKPSSSSQSSPNSRRSSEVHPNQNTQSAKASNQLTSSSQKPKDNSKAKKNSGINLSGLSRFRGGRGSNGNGMVPAYPSGAGTQSGRRSLFKLALSIILAIIMAVGIYVGIIFLTSPSIDTDNIYDQLSQRSTLYDDNGKEIENLYYESGNRTIVKYKDIPKNMVNAVVSIEDKKFWTHHGFNFIRMIGAIKDAVTGGGSVSGTSTVTQQLARNVYLADIKSQRSMGRKITEMYLTIVLEKNMSKKQIMEAYLNSIYLGFNSYGVEAAAQAYYSKDVKDLDLLECASLAALPQSPDSYALVKTSSINNTLPSITTSSSGTYYYNGDLSETRRNAVINNMYDAGYITKAQRDKALKQNLKKKINIGKSSDTSASSYFTDYAIDEVCDDIVSEYGISKTEAKKMIYTNGLKIYTTMDSKMQNIVEDEFADNSNYSGVGYVKRNSSGDILDEDGKVQLRAYSHYFDSKGNFKLKKSEYKKNSDGSITILAGKRLALYDTEVNGTKDVSIEFKSMYTTKGGSFYFIENGALSIPSQYKSSDKNGNCVISAQFFKDYPTFFVKDGDKLVVKKDNYSLKQKIRQPQAATVIMENDTGEIKAMMGGRGATGKQLYNRATSTRQPGSNIKPIGVYGPALQMSYEYSQENKDMDLDTSDGSSWGDYITAGSVINDSAMQYGGKTWPKNWYTGYRGKMTLRKSVEQSVNVNAVKTFLQIGADYSASMLKKVGISSIDEDGSVNDLNPAALALGGMTKGISPLEITAAYAVFPNGGVYKEPIAYTKVVSNNNEVLLEKKSKETTVYDEGVAFIMTDILRTTVTKGLGSAAAISGQPVGGKTGTTSDSYDLWFTGFTPQYTCSLWQGNDINIELSSGSSQSARFWRNIMQRVCSGLERGSFNEMPDDVEKHGGEYYIKGTYSKVRYSSNTRDNKTTKENTREQVVNTTTPTEESNTPTTSAEPTTKEQSSEQNQNGN